MFNNENKVRMGLKMTASGETVSEAIFDATQANGKKLLFVAQKAEYRNMEFGYSSNFNQVVFHPLTGQECTIMPKEGVDVTKDKFYKRAIIQAFGLGIFTIKDDKYVVIHEEKLDSQMFIKDAGSGELDFELGAKACETLSKCKKMHEKISFLANECFESLLTALSEYITIYDLFWIHQEIVMWSDFR